MGEVTLGQRRLDRGLTLQQPVECIVKFVLIDLAEAELSAEARCGGGGRQRTGGGELGYGVKPKRNQLLMTASQSIYLLQVQTQGAAPG